MKIPFISFLITLLFCSCEVSSNEDLLKPKIIVIVDSSSFQTTHSTFFNDLKCTASIMHFFSLRKLYKEKGYEIDFRALNSPTIKLKNYGEYSYDHMIIMASSPFGILLSNISSKLRFEDGKGLTKNKVEEFFDSGRNVIIATDIDASKSIRLLFNEFGVDINSYVNSDKKLGSKVKDHFKFAQKDHTYVTSSNQINQDEICPKLQKPVLYRGAGLSLTPYETHQAYSFLSGEDTTYSKWHESSTSEFNSGNQVALVAATQGRNNARAILTGSVEMLSNSFYKNKNFSNREFINNIVDWGFGLKGILKVGRTTHTRKGEQEIINEIRIKDYLDYSIELFSYNFLKKAWVPYITNDVILEFIMLDPYVRLPLISENNSSLYKASFQVPDKHGVFKLSVKYQKPGFTFLHETHKITVRPFKHDEFPRYIEQAYPYYFSTWATILGFVVLVVYFLIHEDPLILKNEAKKND